MRVQAREGVIGMVQREGATAAGLHGQTSPQEGAETGDRVVTNVPLPWDAVIVTGDSVPAATALSVQGIHWRSEGWCYKVHRLVVLPEGDRFAEPLWATAWAEGAWAGNAVLARAAADADLGLPPEANPA